jgi:hypothetical protein
MYVYLYSPNFVQNISSLYLLCFFCEALPSVLSYSVSFPVTERTEPSSRNNTQPYQPTRDGQVTP